MTATDQSSGQGSRDVNNSIVVLFKGGRRPSWYYLSSRQQQDYSQQHVNLMLTVCQKYHLKHLEGFHLLNPQLHWQRFWIIEFPSLEGAEAWIKSEMAPPYGNYGDYEYHLSRRTCQDKFADWMTRPAPVLSIASWADPHCIPRLQVDRSSVVVLKFHRWLPSLEKVSPKEYRDEKKNQLLQSVAHQHGLMRLEVFQLITPQRDWHQAWLIEFPTFEGAEAWIQAEVSSSDRMCSLHKMYLARPWSPAYFSLWVPPHFAS